MIEQFITCAAQEIDSTHAALLQILVRQQQPGQSLGVTSEQLRAAQCRTAQLAAHPLHLVFHLLLGMLQSIEQRRIKLFNIRLEAVEDLIEVSFGLVKAL